MTTNSQHPAPIRAGRDNGYRASLGVAALMVSLLALDVLTHARPLVMPSLSALLTAGGFAWAAALIVLRRDAQRPLLEQLTGPALLLFFGFAAATLSDVDQLAGQLQALR